MVLGLASRSTLKVLQILAAFILAVMALYFIALPLYHSRHLPPSAAVPESPAIKRSVTNIENATLANPFLPNFRLSNDGRIGLQMDMSRYTASAGYPVGDPADTALISYTVAVTRAELLADGSVILNFSQPKPEVFFGEKTTVMVRNVTGLGVNANGRFQLTQNNTADSLASMAQIRYQLPAGSYKPKINNAPKNASVSGVDGMVARVFINLLKPEAYAVAGSESFHESTDKLKILRSNPADANSPITTVSKVQVDGVEKYFDFPDVLRDKVVIGNTVMTTLCEKPKPNPYACTVHGDAITPGGKQDCYDLYIVSSHKHGQSWAVDGKKVNDQQIFSTKINVVVNHPKTTAAMIDKVIMHKDDFSKGKKFRAKNILEPMVTADGRMMVFRIGTPDYWLGDVDGDGRLYEWEDKGNAYNAADDKDSDGKLDREYAFYNIMYSYNEDKEPCDAAGWSKIYPIAYAHHDPRLKNPDGSYKYGFAEYPFVSPEGEPITNAADGVFVARDPKVCIPAAGATGCTAPADIKGTYPWIDKDGNNLFMKTVAETFHYKEWDRTVKILKDCVDGSNGYPRDGKMELDECKRPSYSSDPDYDNGACSAFGCVATVKTRYPFAAVDGYENDKGVICKRDAMGRDFAVAQKWISINDAPPQQEYLCSDTILSSKWWIREGAPWSGGEQPDNTRGLAVAGRWTKGKIVLLDNLINNTDYGIGIANSQHRLVDLYQDGDKVRIGSSRDTATSNIANGNTSSTIVNPPPFNYPLSTDSNHPLAVAANITFVDSIENTFNFVEKLRPVTPGDVVWKISSGGVTDEVVFDDYLNNNGLIVSNMMASLRYGYTPQNYPDQALLPAQRYPPLAQEYFDYQDGWDGTYKNKNDYTELQANAPDRKLINRHHPEAIRLQNAASSSYLAVPDNGVVLGSPSRIEPVAAGGVHGRGFWLNGDNAIQYAMKDNTAQKITQWYVSLFIDNRSASGERTLITFPDKSALALKDLGHIVYSGAGTAKTVDVSIPQQGWMHLGLQMDAKTRTVSLYIDGYLKDVYSMPASIFRIDQLGNLLIGARSSGFRGWIDDFKVFAEKVNPETACNHAGGTLMGIDAVAASAWQTLAMTYPQSSHDVISNILQNSKKPFYSQYVCYHDYTGDYQAHLGNIPVNAKGQSAGIRDYLLKPEGPLFYDLPRPDFSRNTFCQSCHAGYVDASPLGMSALAFHPGLPAKIDKRRQPMQAPQRVYGVMPDNHWLQSGFQGGDKSYIDEWLMPGQ